MHSPLLLAANTDELLETRFQQEIRPLLLKHCAACHGREKQEGKLNLIEAGDDHAAMTNHGLWEVVLERVAALEMPPATSSDQLTDSERGRIVQWIRDLQDSAAIRNAGDPGIVLARRLSNAEYDYSVRDLTGVDLRPTREFPVDPANPSGFDNSGESLTMSPALVKKYLEAARFVADHLILTPTGFTFAPDLAVAETDRDKYCVHQIVRFYERHRVDFADYLFAAWRYRNREAAGMPEISLEQIAMETFTTRPKTSEAQHNPPEVEPVTANSASAGRIPISEKYLRIVWNGLTAPITQGPLAELQREWSRLPIDPSQAVLVRQECERLRDQIIQWRKELDTPIEKLHVTGNSDGSQPLILWWNRQQAARRTSYAGDGKDRELDASRHQFCQIFPNAFSISSRGLYADPNLGAQVRLLTAGFHLMQGYFRDDTPLCELVLDDTAKNELDSLWRNLNFVTQAPIRQYKDFLFFERAEPPQFAGGPEFDFARPENKDVTSVAKLTQMKQVYLAKALKNQASPAALEAIEHYFDSMLADIRWIEETQQSSQTHHLDSLMKFAERAYRRPLTPSERVEQLAFYHHLREEDGLQHEDAMRDCVASILMSPHFLFRVDLADADEPVRTLNDFELASRLSYFLWASLPDDQLLEHARRGDLHEPDVLLSQTHRMLNDARIRGLATEFAGHWLDFSRFEEHNSVDRERFSSFTNELRQSMYEEPIRLFIAIVTENRSIFDFLDTKEVHLNPTLARHYGFPLGDDLEADDDAGAWFRVENAGQSGRGGLLGMSVFLTRNSPGLRTSPVKRGYWVVKNLLGEHIPPPPPNVAELPKDEAETGDLSLPQLLARHRDHQACAACHRRFDSIGLVFEDFGPIGERRTHDLGGRPVINSGLFPDGVERQGIEGLRHYLLNERRQDFINHFCRKLLSYSLGRGLLLSDRSTIEAMKERLRADEGRFHAAVDVIVASPQFLRKRGTNMFPD